MSVLQGPRGLAHALVTALDAATVADAAEAVASADKAIDLVIALDGVDAPDAQAYRARVASVARAATLGALIAGHDGEPAPGSSAIPFHAPLLHTLEALDDITAIPMAGDDRGVTYFALRAPGVAHPRDISTSTLRRAIPFVAERLELVEAMTMSRRVLGFFPEHIARCVEYPWALSRIRALGPAAQRVVDVGAGLNVLPCLLHADGRDVTTVDSYPLDRTGTDRAGWTEWGFLDYASLRPGIRSERVPYEQYAPPAHVDVIYSVSVIEHLSAAVRGQWMKRMAAHLRPGGRLLLTVDTVPFSTRLWPYSEGKLVEPIEEHGTLDDLKRDLSAHGFDVRSVKAIDWMPLSRVGIALIEADRA